MLACRKGCEEKDQKKYTDIIKKLIEKGADVNEKDNDGETALMIESKNGHVEIVQELIKAKAKVNDKDNKKRRREKE